MDLGKIIEPYREEIIKIRRHLHQNPELSHQEYKTAETLKKILNEWGITIQDFPMDNAVIALIEGEKKGHTIMIRADIDALPIVEDTGLEFKSACEGVSHACGHDIHMSIALLLAKALQDNRNLLKGNVRLVFQPAEEVALGAKELFKNGLLSLEPKSDIVLGMHTSPEHPIGILAVMPGPMNASFDNIYFTVHSPGGHGAYPHRTPDPIVASANLIMQLQTIVSREKQVMQPAVFTVGAIHGGTSSNIIPTQVELTGNMRTFNTKVRKDMIESIKRIAKGCAISSQCPIDVNVEEGLPVLDNDPLVTEELMKSVDKEFGPGHMIFIEEAKPGSDDFSCYLKELPGCYFKIGTANDKPQSALGIHHPKNIFDEEAIFIGAKALLAYIINHDASIRIY